MKKTLRIISILIISFQPLFSQPNDPFEFFPHHEGDIWEYFVAWDLYTYSHYQIEFISDSVSEGNTYIEAIYRDLDYNEEMMKYYFIDTSYNVWRLGSEFNTDNGQHLYKLNAEPSDYWVVHESDTTIYEIASMDTLYEGMYYGDTVTFAIINYYSVTDNSTDPNEWTWIYSRKLATGFGYIGGEAHSNGGTNMTGAIIDGVQYGNVTGLSTDKGNSLLPETVIISNFPNPFNSETEIKISFPSQTNSTLRIFDINGKTVLTFWENKNVNPGIVFTKWNGTNNANVPV